jgi:hypothetical protein
MHTAFKTQCCQKLIRPTLTGREKEKVFASFLLFHFCTVGPPYQGKKEKEK